MWKHLLSIAALLLTHWSCNNSDLPAAYRRLEVPVERLGSVAARQRGRELFLQSCALCHGERADGRGIRRNLSSRPQDFTDPTWSDSVTPTQVFVTIREGRRGTAMPSWKSLKDDEIWDLVAYLDRIADEGP